jgi:rhamnose utilization protein RhaD (predicted bifunctional aldolase and dehydrogenase)/NAD(P)-dependent dehydrogenase (short-subunit alcohol dehydrogenase family)
VNEQRRFGVRSLPPSPVDTLAELIALAQRFGRDPQFSRGGGGNASAKADGVLYIKPSGVALATLEADDLIPLDIERLLALLEGDHNADGGADAHGDPVLRAARSARLGEAGGRRPSVELLFHALLPGRFVLHTHPVLLNAVTCAAGGAALAERLFGDRAVWVPYADPGLPLARAIAEMRRALGERTGLPAPAIVLMQNHGVVVTADTAAEIGELYVWLVSIVQAAVDGAAAIPDPSAGPDPVRARVLVDAIGPTLRGLLAGGSTLRVVTFDETPLAASFPATPAGRDFVRGGPLTPDQIVYAGSWPMLVDVPDDLAADDVPALLGSLLDEHTAAHGVPIIVVVPGLGLFASGDTWAEADTARHIYLDALRVGAVANRLGGVRALADHERRFIETWEAEVYRRGIAAGISVAGGAAGSRFEGRVALVTGAAQGFGLAIAADLVAEGGHVVLADVNGALAAANAADLEARFGPGRATAVTMNVMDEASVADCLHATVERYGGLDLLVSNAGVLRAGSVTAQPLAEFDLVTSVNYRGYFLAVRFAAPILARQHAARPASWGDIIEINSKSGLVGSSRNSAYAGSKFGGIGLTQSFALELVDQGIKVNAICPGNFFDGPLWSDPANGLFVQYLREGKVPGARTVDDVREFYEAKVPMRRGCRPEDVLRAIYYLVAQQYETGQALPVTGGQVMLS